MTYSSNARLGWLTGIMVGLGLIAIGVPSRMVTGISQAVEKGRIQANADQLAGAAEVSNTFRMVAKVARPGVVQIRVLPSEQTRGELLENEREQQATRERINELSGNADADQRELLDLTRRLTRLQDRHEQLEERLSRGTASGILYDTDGHILTNNHVVEDRSNIRVRLHDNREFEATMIGADSKTDLAVIKIDAPGLNPLSFGDSDSMEVGDWVLAVGAPFGLSQSVTHGIISAKGRNEIDTGRRAILYQNFMQTDAAINPGNSGGPLVNLRGEVIGVNTAIATDGSGYNAGVAFTIPSNMARRIAEQLKTSGAVARGWLGLSLQDLRSEDVKLFGLANDNGAMVDVVYSGSAADKAGLRPEDIILEVNGTAIADVAGLRNAIADASPGKPCRLVVARDGGRTELTAVLERQPENQDAYIAEARAIAARSMRELPLNVRSLRPGLMQSILRQRESRELAVPARTYLEADRQGVFVMEARTDGKTGMYNIEAGDLVVSANDVPVASVFDLAKALDASAKRQSIELQVVNVAGEKRTVEMRLR